MKPLGLVLGGLSTVVLVAYVAISLSIGESVRALADSAMEQHEGDAVQALCAVARDEGVVPRERSRAVWALGQLGDERALPTLALLDVGSGCDHDRWPCAQEIEKARRACEGGVNLSAPLWR